MAMTSEEKRQTIERYQRWAKIEVAVGLLIPVLAFFCLTFVNSSLAQDDELSTLHKALFGLFELVIYVGGLFATVGAMILLMLHTQKLSGAHFQDELDAHAAALGRDNRQTLDRIDRWIIGLMVMAIGSSYWKIFDNFDAATEADAMAATMDGSVGFQICILFFMFLNFQKHVLCPKTNRALLAAESSHNSGKFWQLGLFGFFLVPGLLVIAWSPFSDIFSDLVADGLLSNGLPAELVWLQFLETPWFKAVAWLSAVLAIAACGVWRYRLARRKAPDGDGQPTQ